METVDDDILRFATDFMDKAKQANQPFFVWLNPTRMHVITHLSKKYAATMTPENGYYTEEGGMAQLDDIVGSVMRHLREMGVENDTILAFTTDNGAENFTWPDGGNTPFAGGKGTVMEGGMRVPMVVRWPGHIGAGKIQNGLMSGLDWSQPWSPPQATRTSSTNSRVASRWAIAPTKFTWMATTRRTC